MTALAQLGAMVRRELAGYVHAPIAYVVGVLFLAVQGLSFWALVEVLSDPARPAPLGAVLSGYFGGSLLYWMVLLLVVATLAMRLVAEEKRQGTWELLLTAPVDERTVLVGKWLGAVGFYICLWMPTLLYLGVLAWFAPPGASFDAGPVASAYLGVILGGAGFLALGLAASTATDNQIVAAVATTVVLLALLIVGQLGELAPSWLEDSPKLAAVIGWIDLRDHMDRFARGAIDLGPIVFYLGLAAFGTALARAVSALGRRRSGEVQARLLAALLVGVIVVLANVIAERHPHRWDATRADVNSLDPATVRLLQRVEEPIELLVVRPGEAAYEELWVEVGRVIDRMQERQPLLRRIDVDPSLELERMAGLASEFAISPADLVDGGAVVLRAGERKRIVDLLDVAGFEEDPLGAGRLSGLHAEEAIASAIAEIGTRDRPVICTTAGHGEIPPEPTAESPVAWSALAERLEREGMVIEEVGEVSVEVPAYCRALVVFGPVAPLSPDEAIAVSRYLERGGALFVAALALLDPADPTLPGTGLELVLDDYGISLPQAIAVDPFDSARVEGMPGAFRVVAEYGDHPISGSYRGRRFTVWRLPRVVGVREPAVALVSTSAYGWGETELDAVGASTDVDDRDIEGPVPIAAASSPEDRQGRVVVFGSARSLSSEVISRRLGAGDALAATSVTWLVGRDRQVEIGDKTPEQLRLVMTPAERKGVFVLCVVVIPLLFAGIGGVAWRIRRRG